MPNDANELFIIASIYGTIALIVGLLLIWVSCTCLNRLEENLLRVANNIVLATTRLEAALARLDPVKAVPVEQPSGQSQRPPGAPPKAGDVRLEVVQLEVAGTRPALVPTGIQGENFPLVPFRGATSEQV